MKTCLITGASGGIGAEIAKALSLNGYKVLLQGRNKEKLRGLQCKLHGPSDVIPGDLTRQKDRDAIVDVISAHSELDLLVNAAGISQFSAYEQTDEASLTQLITTNLLSPMLFIQAFLNAHRANASRADNKTFSIVNIGSAFGYIGYPGFAGYCASKFGLRGLTESLSREYADSQYRFVYFAPRATHTSINSDKVQQMNRALKNTVDTPEFVANEFIQFLQSHKREATVGWPEKLFVKVNAVLPKLVDKAMKSKLPLIKQFL
uniref:SDR family oxidoreductase n=1 Tax=Ningiella ruwaisensis TaxID=2364274 RepID=UPI00109F3D1E|nr:SDR family oxidoreductase [Ningiella ruwaisensis]